MISIPAIIFYIIAPLLIIGAIINYFFETQPQRIRRMRREGKSQRAIAAALGITTYRVRKALA